MHSISQVGKNKHDQLCIKFKDKDREEWFIHFGFDDLFVKWLSLLSWLNQRYRRTTADSPRNEGVDESLPLIDIVSLGFLKNYVDLTGDLIQHVTITPAYILER